jgi:hypothetical protein
MLRVTQNSNKYVLGGQLIRVSHVQSNKPGYPSTYVDVQDLGDK